MSYDEYEKRLERLVYFSELSGSEIKYKFVYERLIFVKDKNKIR